MISTVILSMISIGLACFSLGYNFGRNKDMPRWLKNQEELLGYYRKEEARICKECESENTEFIFVDAGTCQQKQILKCNDCGHEEEVASLTFTEEE